MSRELELGKTVIASITGRVKGQPQQFSIYYGNIALPMIDNQYMHLPIDKYKGLIDKFFSDPQNADYIRPTEEQLRADCQKMIDIENESEYGRKKKAEEERKEKEKLEKAQEEERREENQIAVLREIKDLREKLANSTKLLKKAKSKASFASIFATIATILSGLSIAGIYYILHSVLNYI